MGPKISNVLITGSTGFVGKPLNRHLIKLGINVTGSNTGKPESKIDVTDRNQLHSVQEGAEAVIHLAAKTSVKDSFKNPYEVYCTNLMGTLNVLEFCKLRNIGKFIFMSSYVYGQPKYLPVDEKHPVNPHSPYHKSKVLCEKLCENYSSDFEIDVVVLRPFLLYGPDAKPYMFMSTVINQIKKSGNVFLSGKNTTRDFLFISDFLGLITIILNDFPKGYNLYNVGYGKGYPLEEVVRILATIVSKEVKIDYDNQIRPGDVTKMVADISKVSNKFQWQPRVTLEDGLRMTIEKDLCV